MQYFFSRLQNNFLPNKPEKVCIFFHAPLFSHFDPTNHDRRPNQVCQATTQWLIRTKRWRRTKLESTGGGRAAVAASLSLWPHHLSFLDARHTDNDKSERDSVCVRAVIITHQKPRSGIVCDRARATSCLFFFMGRGEKTLPPPPPSSPARRRQDRQIIISPAASARASVWLAVMLQVREMR